MNATLEPKLTLPELNGNRPDTLAKTPEPTPQPHADVDQQGKRIQELIARVDSLPNAETRELLHECIQAVLTLHGDGLERILQLLKNAGMPGREVSSALLSDKLVRGLLLIHGLHPVPLEARLREALDKVRPYMKSHGGNVELVHLENETAKLRLEGACKSCPSSSATLELAVRQAVEEACPDLLGFEVEGVVAQAAATDHLPANAPKWTVMEDFIPLKDGAMRVQEISGVPVIFFQRGENLYSYRNVCPACANKLNEGAFEDNLVTCRLGHRFNVQRAGASPDNPEIHLEPFPLLAANGLVKISVRKL